MVVRRLWSNDNVSEKLADSIDLNGLKVITQSMALSSQRMPGRESLLRSHRNAGDMEFLLAAADASHLLLAGSGNGHNDINGVPADTARLGQCLHAGSCCNVCL